MTFSQHIKSSSSYTLHDHDIVCGLKISTPDLNVLICGHALLKITTMSPLWLCSTNILYIRCNFRCKSFFSRKTSSVLYMQKHFDQKVFVFGVSVSTDSLMIDIFVLTLGLSLLSITVRHRQTVLNHRVVQKEKLFPN